MWSRALLSAIVRFQDDRREEKRGFRRSDQFLNVHDDGTLNEAVHEERTQLERSEVGDERVKRDPHGVNGNETETTGAKKKVPRETP